MFFHSYVSLPKGTSFCRVNMFNLKYIQRLERWIWNHEDMEPWIKGLSTPHQPLSGAHWSIARSASLSTNFPSWTYRKSFTIPYNSDFWKEKNLWFYQIHHASKGYNHLQPHFVMVKSPCFCKKHRSQGRRFTFRPSHVLPRRPETCVPWHPWDRAVRWVLVKSETSKIYPLVN